MTRFYGNVGYGESEENPADSGNWVDVITERDYYGDVIRNTRKLDPNTESVNSDISVGNSISIMADEYAFEHWHLIKYVEWEGQRWTVPLVEVQRPRLLLSIGKVYNGPTAI
jgi:hypothetical protein